MNQGLVQSTATISSSNNTIYKALESRLKDPQYSKAEKWQPKAYQIKLISDSFIQYISVLKNELQKSVGSNEELYAKGNFEVVNRLFDDKGRELYNRLINYKKEILSVDSSLKNQFEHTVKLVSEKFDYTKNDTKDFTKFFFNKIPAIAAMAVLNRFENDVKINENDFILFCLNQTHNIFCGYFTKTALIIGQSVNYVQGGDYIEINGGVGSFSVIAKPIMKIDGKIVQPNTEGLMTYKIKASTKAGAHGVPVTIEYIKEDGSSESKTYNIVYTVIKSN